MTLIKPEGELRILVDEDRSFNIVRVYLVEQRPDCRIYMWPESWSGKPGSVGDAQVWTSKLVPNLEKAEDVRPLLEMWPSMWAAFKKGILTSEHQEPNAVPILVRALEVERQRVDKLMNIMLTPHMVTERK